MRTKEADHILDMTVKAIFFPDSSKYGAPFRLMDDYNICPNKSYPIILSKSHLSRINAWEPPGQKGGSKNRIMTTPGKAPNGLHSMDTIRMTQ